MKENIDKNINFFFSLLFNREIDLFKTLNELSFFSYLSNNFLKINTLHFILTSFSTNIYNNNWLDNLKY